jgi:hypothetical protein
MSSVRMMQGIVSATGERVNTLTVEDMVDRVGPRYRTRCDCGALSTTTHKDIRTGVARCKSSDHNSAAVNRQLEATRKAGKRDAIKSAAELERQAQRARERESLARMEAETAGYTLPASRPKNLVNDSPMTQRERISLREHRLELESQEAAEREAREAHIRIATEQLNEIHNELIALQRERLLSNIKDVDAYVDPAVATVHLSEEEASDYNREQFNLYRSTHPNVFWNEMLLEQVGAYFERNGLRIISAAMIDNVLERFKEAALLPERPTPEPTQPYKPKPTVNLTIAAPKTELVPTAFLLTLAPGLPPVRSAQRTGGFSCVYGHLHRAV